MSKLFRNASPGALTLQQSVAASKKQRAERARQKRTAAEGRHVLNSARLPRAAQELAAEGRGGDTEVAHVARGELVIPRALQNSEVLAALARAGAAHNITLERLLVGSAENSINPNTDAPEFDIGAIIAMRPYLQPYLGNLFTGDKNPAAAQLPSDMPTPQGASLSKNIQEAKDTNNPFWFYNQVRNRAGEPDHKWDYKQEDRKYEDFGNFNYGATGAALGFPDGILKRAAGFAQGRAKTSDPEFGHWWDISGSYGDDPNDQKMIQKGIDYYRNGGR